MAVATVRFEKAWQFPPCFGDTHRLTFDILFAKDDSVDVIVSSNVNSIFIIKFLQ